MNDDLLKLDVALLLHRYGRQKVLAVLADIEAIGGAELFRMLDALRAKKAKEQALKTRKTLSERFEKKLENHPSGSAIRTLIGAYEAGTFLPTTKSVQRFFESLGLPKITAKSRKDAGPKVFEAMIRLSDSEIEGLRRSFGSNERNDFSLLSDAILKRPAHSVGEEPDA